MDTILCSSPRSVSKIRTPLLLIAGLAAVCAGFGALVMAESGLIPGFGYRLDQDVRLVLGAQGALLCLVGTLMVARTGRKSPAKQPEHALCGFYGLNRIRSGDEFQTFGEVNGDSRPVQAMWADPTTDSRICARVDKNGRFLRVEFLNDCQARPCSVSIRSMENAALLNAGRRPCLQFQARVPTCEPRYTRPGSQRTRENAHEYERAPKRVQGVALTVRLVNGMLQHWAWHGRAKEPKQWVVAGQGWKTFKMPLDKGWARFSAEGNPEGPARPDLNVLAAVVFDVGADGDFPDGAYGVVDIRDIRCVD